MSTEPGTTIDGYGLALKTLREEADARLLAVIDHASKARDELRRGSAGDARHQLDQARFVAMEVDSLLFSFERLAPPKTEGGGA